MNKDPRGFIAFIVYKFDSDKLKSPQQHLSLSAASYRIKVPCIISKFHKKSRATQEEDDMPSAKVGVGKCTTAHAHSQYKCDDNKRCFNSWHNSVREHRGLTKDHEED